MAALVGPRAATVARDSRDFVRDVAANVKIFQGALVCLSATGYATPGATATTLIADGVAQATVDNSTGAAGALQVSVKKGTYRFNNSSAGDLITRTEIGKDCYVVDDQTVAKTDGGTTRSKAGRVVDVDSVGVWVKFD
jgi:hypothetical protein